MVRSCKVKVNFIKKEGSNYYSVAYFVLLYYA